MHTSPSILIRVGTAALVATLAATTLAGCGAKTPSPAPSASRTAPALTVPVGPSAAPSPGATPTPSPGGDPTASKDPTPPTDTDKASDPTPAAPSPTAAPLSAENPAPGVSCGDYDIGLKGLCVVDLPGWPSQTDMYAAGAVAQHFVATVWDMEAFGQNSYGETVPTSPAEAMSAAIAGFGTDHLATVVKGLATGPTWDAWVGMGGGFASSGLGYMEVEPVLDGPHDASTFQVQVSYRIRAHAGNRHTDNWYGDQSYMKLTLANTANGWRVDDANPAEMPAAKIEDHGPSFM